jgi:hypothetical protein
LIYDGTTVLGPTNDTAFSTISRVYLMLTITVSAVLVMTSWSGGLPCGHGEIREDCSLCCEENPLVQEQIERLQSCSGWIARRKAARALRKYDWKCHPEAAEALAEALQHDRNCLVRQEAAESLAKMRPCLPTVHEAVMKVVKCDSSLLTRLRAKKALKAIGKSCVEACSVCGNADEVIIDGPLPSPITPGTAPRPLDSSVEPLPPGRMEVPENPSELSPFTPGLTPPLPPPIPGARRAPGPGKLTEPDRDSDGPALESPATSSAPSSLRLPRTSGRPNLAASLMRGEP